MDPSAKMDLEVKACGKAYVFHAYILELSPDF